MIVAPDSFKGSLSAPAAAAAIARGIRQASPDVEVLEMPVSDGGDSLLEVLEPAGFRPVTIETSGPIGAPLDTSYAVRGDTAVVELAAASGLNQLPAGHLAPLDATSYGTGVLMRDAIERGARRIVLGLGGSACTDGGAGLLEGLGAELRDLNGGQLGRGGGVLRVLSSVDLRPCLRLCDGVEVVLACDVDNPLFGPTGAATVFGPQKGASRDDIRALEAGLHQWVECCETAHPVAGALAERPGAGAAGGTAFGALAGCGATIARGIDLVLELLDFDRALETASLVVTGEGRLDTQSLRGKAPAGVAAHARAAGVPVVAVAGRVDLRQTEARTLGLAATYALTDLCADQQQAMSDAADLLTQVGARIGRESGSYS
ncbi:hypothetical protein VV02_06800 [Luteipulveratus mongoliensis]|uniref:Glycerate kinase n=1 Tax=Luteipulveratus mongoliensis TaxID=571913 RepID=A0A0K1JPS2_9MICO|nr:hypothetical protein VV02_06800 [Luteipulveratus mongoliensis]